MEPTVRELLLAKLDELVDMTTRDLDEILLVTEQLEPDRAQACRIAVGWARLMLDEVRLRVHGRPLDEPEP